MIEVKLLNDESSIIEITHGEWRPDNWKALLRKNASSNEQIVFRINFLDDNGLVLVVLRYWLKFAGTIFIETNHDWIKEILYLTFLDKVKFK